MNALKAMEMVNEIETYCAKRMNWARNEIIDKIENQSGKYMTVFFKAKDGWDLRLFEEIVEAHLEHCMKEWSSPMINYCYNMEPEDWIETDEYEAPVTRISASIDWKATWNMKKNNDADCESQE